MSLLPRSRLRQPGVWGPAHSRESETPVTSDRPGIKVSPTFALKRSSAPTKKRLMQTEAGSVYKGMILEDVFKLFCIIGSQWLN